MRTSPSVVPHEADTYLVLDDFGWIGCSWRETDKGRTDREAVIRALKQFPPDLNLRDSQTVSDDGDSVH